MEYRFPKWICIGTSMFVLAPATILAGAMKPTLSAITDTRLVLVGAGACLLPLLVWVYLCVSRFRIELSVEGLNIAGLYRVRFIPFDAIANVVTTSYRSTDSWLLEKSDRVVAKLDGNLNGYEDLLTNLCERLRPYRATFYRYGSGLSEMQLAGDKKWVPYECPRSIRRAISRPSMIVILCALVAVATSILVSELLRRL